MQSYLGEVTLASLMSDDALDMTLDDRRERMRHFLQRKPEEDLLGGLHRPKKRHRRSAMQVGCHLHSVFKGWAPEAAFQWQVPVETEKRIPAIQRPCGSLVPDQGADNVSLANRWSRRLHLNIDWPFDVHCHGLHNDILLGIQAGGKHDHLQLSLIRMNVSCSPWGEATRWKQANEQLQETFDFSSHRSDLAFQETLFALCLPH